MSLNDLNRKQIDTLRHFLKIEQLPSPRTVYSTKHRLFQL